MASDRDLDGWTWLESTAASAEDRTEQELCRAFARCLASADGRQVMQHLERVILNRRLAPDSSDAALRHLEGQRYAVAHIATMAARGRT